MIDFAERLVSNLELSKKTEYVYGGNLFDSEIGALRRSAEFRGRVQSAFYRRHRVHLNIDIEGNTIWLTWSKERRDQFLGTSQDSWLGSIKMKHKTMDKSNNHCNRILYLNSYYQEDRKESYYNLIEKLKDHGFELKICHMATHDYVMNIPLETLSRTIMSSYNGFNPQ